MYVCMYSICMVQVRITVQYIFNYIFFSVYDIEFSLYQLNWNKIKSFFFLIKQWVFIYFDQYFKSVNIYLFYNIIYYVFKKYRMKNIMTLMFWSVEIRSSKIILTMVRIISVYSSLIKINCFFFDSHTI